MRGGLVEFVDWAGGHRLWTLTAGLALLCVSYAFAWFGKSAQRDAQHLRADVEVRVAEADWDRYSAVVGHIGGATESFALALQRYRDDFTNKPFPSRPVARTVTEPGLAMIDSARAKVADARGFILGSTFFDAALEARRPMLASDLLLLDSMSTYMRRFYVAAAAGDHRGMHAANQAIRLHDQHSRESWNAALARLGAFSEAGLASGYAQIGKLYETAGQRRWQRLEQLMAWAAIAYVVCFTIAATRTYVRRNRTFAT